MKTAAPLSTRIVRLLVGSLSTLSFAAGIGASSAYAATITVTRQSDGTLQELDGNGQCDLREAIEASNTDT
ncbi:MAG: hypothetical protein GY906_04005, partial [bacterium]|nr:hypothetical protein [bacterium]